MVTHMNTNPTTRTPVRSIEIAAVSDDEIIAFTRSGWGQASAVREAAQVAAAEGKIVNLRFNGEVIEVTSDHFED